MVQRKRKSPTEKKKKKGKNDDPSAEDDSTTTTTTVPTNKKKQRVDTKVTTATASDSDSPTVNQDEINHHFSIIHNTSSNGNNTKTLFKYLDQLEESGYVELKLWPLFQQQISIRNENKKEARGDCIIDLKQCAYLIALLINQRCSLKGNGSKDSSASGGGDDGDTTNGNGGSGPLSFVLNIDSKGDTTLSSSSSFEIFLENLLEYQQSSSYTSINIETTKVQFLIIAYTSLTKNTSSTIKTTLLNLVDIGMWKYMPVRYRDLELRKVTAYKRRWDIYCSSSSSYKNSKNTKRSGGGDDEEEDGDVLRDYIPQKVVELFLSTMNAFELNNSNNNNNNDDIEAAEEEESNNKKTIKAPQQKLQLEYLHVVLQLFLDLLSTTTTRRFLRPFLLSINFSVKCTLSQLFRSSFLHSSSSKPSSRLFIQLVTMLQDLETFSINDLTSAPLSKSDMASLYHDRAHVLQKLTHRHYPNEFSELIYAGVGMITEYGFLKRNLDRIVNMDILVDVAYRLRLIPTKDMILTGDDDVDEEEIATSKKKQREFVTAVMLYHHTLRPTETQTLSGLPLYPDEKLLWNPYLVPPGNLSLLRDSDASLSSTLALPKMNTQFLTFGDYLLRSFKLLRLESAYEIRSDLVDTIKRMRPMARHGYGNDHHDDLDEDEFWASKRSMTEFHGWSRMGLELTENKSCPVKIVKVSPPKLGESIPSQVIAEITLDLKRFGQNIRNEWDEIGEHDNLFMVAIDATQMEDVANDEKPIPDEEDVSFPQRFGIIAVRGCTVMEARDSEGNVLSDPSRLYNGSSESKSNDRKLKDHKRILTVSLDPAQYAADATGEGSALGSKVYQMLNIVVRRKGKENNFKAVLETIRGLMQGSASINRSVPSWLQPVFLGYGDPASALFSSKSMINFAKVTSGVTTLDASLDYGDTFLDEDHLKASFPDAEVSIEGKEKDRGRSKYKIRMVGESDEDNWKVLATAYPFEGDANGNSVRFTPNQVNAIRSGLSPGLTMIVGPPGTGKTDVATQIIANLYHSFPSQRTVIVTHSNAALNDLFEKVTARGDIDERYMLRLGSGERDLQTDSEFDFTKIGRVNHILSRRANLLEEVQRLSESLGVSGAAERGPDGAPSYTCETAEYFQLHHIKKRVHNFLSTVKGDTDPSGIAKIFPFKKYFNLSGGTMTLTEATKKFEIINRHFTELAEYRPLELLRSQRQRTDYLLTKQARIVAMTCTHAAIARSQLVELGFQYDNIVMEEAGQMLDIETFVPLLLQRGETGSHSSDSRLKRITLIGDHHQLPPVVKNMSFSKYSNLDQSLFTRLIRLGVPTFNLNRQGRARPHIANLYNWRYKDLGNLDHVNTKPAFLKANAGFAHTHQIINVEDYEGRGESTPTPYFYQNVGEAEYSVALFQYMVLIGYPPEKISILTTYNGQKDLLNDIILSRCGPDTPFGGVRPGAISTVDHYQGQQNDYVILSLVRTRSIGHLRDIRRLVVAVSRARLGLYVLCRQKVFSGCHELSKVFDQFSNISNHLELITGEQYPTKRSLNDEITEDEKYTVKDVVALGSIVHGMQQQLCKDAMED